MSHHLRPEHLQRDPDAAVTPTELADVVVPSRNLQTRIPQENILPPHDVVPSEVTLDFGEEGLVVGANQDEGFDLATALANRRKLDDASIERFFDQVKTDVTEVSESANAVFGVLWTYTVPLACVFVGCPLSMLILAIVSLASNGATVLAMKISLVVCLSILLCMCCCLFFVVLPVALLANLPEGKAKKEDLNFVDDGKINFSCKTCKALLLLCARRPEVIGGILGCPMCLCGLACVVLSAVVGATQAPSTSSTVSWVIFALIFACVGFLFVFPVTILGSVGLGVSCCLDKCDDEDCCCEDGWETFYKVFTCCGCAGKCVKQVYSGVRMRSQPCMKAIAEEFLHQQLQIDQRWFREVNCYCRRCFTLGRFQRSAERAGQKYSVPCLWTRFGLHPVRGAELRGLDKWYLAYHGTSGLSAKAIIETQRMLMPGDRRPDGGLIEVRPGHIEDESFVRNVFMSPSITYVSSPVYSVSHNHDQKGKTFRCLVALELLIQPETFEVGPETLGAKEKNIEIDPLFPNDKIEWFTNRRGVMEVNAVLVKVEEVESESGSG